MFFKIENYRELKSAKQIMTQNQNKIEELENLMLQIENEAEYTNLLNQLQILKTEQLSLEADINSAKSGFSLFGWLNKIIIGD